MVGLECHLSALLVFPPKLNSTRSVLRSVAALAFPEEHHCSLVHIRSGMVLKGRCPKICRACDKGWVVVSNTTKPILITDTLIVHFIEASYILTIFPVTLQPRRRVESLIVFHLSTAFVVTPRCLHEGPSTSTTSSVPAGLFLSRHFFPTCAN